MSDRKYRQRGYQDGDRPEGGRRGAPAPRSEGPRGRGLGAPTRTVFRCARCGALQKPAAAPEPDSVCAECGADLHTCTHCRHFDTSAPGECRRPAIPRVSSKAKRNQCGGFEPKASQELESGSSRSDPRAAFDALFDL